jgi:predicted secreted hydrolase
MIIKRSIFLVLGFLFISFKFPEDHSFHKNYALEWVYFVGHLEANTGETFGYELSFFRLAVKNEKSDSNIEIFPVHFAISDPKEKKHRTFETLQRNIGKLAGYTSDQIFSGEYSMKIINKNKFRITAEPRFQNSKIDFFLSTDSVPLVHGDQGKSIKSRTKPNLFSYYYSYPRLKTTGVLLFEGKEYEIVSGNSWMDHEWSEKGESNFSFVKKQTTWDWLSLSVDDGSDFVSFSFRTEKDSMPEFTGILRDATGKIHRYERASEVIMAAKKDGYWTSNLSGIQYPLSWKVTFPGGYWDVTPVFNEQEFNGLKSTGIIYWEGMVQAEGEIDGKKRTAKGYLELKGYNAQPKWWEY